MDLKQIIHYKIKCHEIKNKYGCSFSSQYAKRMQQR